VDAERGGLPLAFALRALAAAPSASLQLLIAPCIDSPQHWADGPDDPNVERRGPVLPALVGTVVATLLQLLGGGEFARPTQPRARSAPVHREPAFRTEIRLRVSARAKAEARMHANAIAATFRGFDGGSRWRPRRVFRVRRFDRAHAGYRPSWSDDVRLQPRELASLFHLGGDALGFGGARFGLSTTGSTNGPGKVICHIDDGRRSPATLSVADARHHMHVLGSTGVGKTTLLLNLAQDDIVSGRGVGIIDPKGDLIRSMLERIARKHWERVVLIDPAQRDQPVGLNVIACGDSEQRELVCDQIVTIFRKTYEQSWGARTDHVLRGAVLTLLHRPGSTICELPVLLLHPERFRELIDGLGDPVGLGSFWHEYRALSDAQRLQWIGPVLNKLSAVLLRPTIRNIFGQSQSTVDLAQCMDEGRIVLMSLAKGPLGEETSRLLGAFLIARLWQAALGRADRPEAQRRDFVLYLDEFQNYLHLPNSFAEVLAEARGYHLGLVLANQHLGQLTSATREAIAANARSRVVFQCGQDDARALAKEFEPSFGERELRDLGRFEVAVRLCQDGRTGRPIRGLTRPESPSLGEAQSAALQRYVLGRIGRKRTDVEREIEQRIGVPREPEPDPADVLGGVWRSGT
jgi:hypothetical protein